MNTHAAPDGGWGWIIVLAYALANVCTVPVMQGFGLVFKDVFPVLGINGAKGSTIINLNLAFGMILGLINGPLLRKFGYRKVAFAGSLIYSIGITLTAFARTFLLILLSYGLLASVGTALITSSFSLALNTYFATRRNRATGIAITLVGIGSTLMPPVTTFLMDHYGPQGTILLYGAYSCHTLVATMLLQPVKWHVKKATVADNKEAKVKKARKKIDEEITENGGKHLATDILNNGTAAINEDECSIEDEATIENGEISRMKTTTLSDIDHDVEVTSVYGFDTPLPRQLSETATTASYERSIDGWTPINYSELTASNLYMNNKKASYHWWSSGKSIDTVNLGSSMKIFEETGGGYQTLRKSVSFHASTMNRVDDSEDDFSTRSRSSREDLTEKKRSIVMRILVRVVAFYDLNLLKDPIYVNIMIGMSIAIFAEVNFSFLTPFILEDRGLATGEIANTMSIIAIVDLIFRAIAPYLGDWLRQPPRTMYLISLVFLIISRSSLMFFRTFKPIIGVAIGLGIAKGIRSVYMSLVIPSYVPIHRLAYAFAIQMVVNGFILIAAGPFLGVIKDMSGNYTICVVVINCMTALTIVIWLIELTILRRRKARSEEEEKKQKQKQQQQQQTEHRELVEKN